MQIVCDGCGCDRFKAGYIEHDPQGGFNILMPCANCGLPKLALHDYDPDLAKAMLQFFAGKAAS